jgi:branched-chain amino acid aminotransferase
MELVKKRIFNIERVKESRLPSVDFDNIPFGRVFSDHMLVADFADGKWGEPKIVPYGEFNISPCLSALHYGQSFFEGMKAYKTQDGRPVLFRPWENHARMNHSAERMCMPELPADIFMDGLAELVRLDQDWIPTKAGCSLYIRPFMFATDAYVSIRPSDTYRFMMFTCPVSAYYAKPVNLMVTAKYARAFHGGTGEAKAAGNYGGSLLGAREANQKGYDNVLWLDAREHKYFEECGTMNVFFVIDGVAITPELTGTILHGTTRSALIQLLKDMGVEVQERLISAEEVWDAYETGRLQEIFGAGTAATVAHADRVGHDGTVPALEGRDEIQLPPIESRKIAPALLKQLEGIRSGILPDVHGWLMPV